MILLIRFRLLVSIAILALLLSLPAAPASALTIRAGLEQNPPLSFIDDQGQPSGMLVDLLNEIAAVEGWQIEYVPDTFKRCLEKLENHDIDLMVTIAWSEARAKLYDFNQLNVVAVWGALYTPAGSDIVSYFELEGKKIAVVRGDIHHQALRTMLKNFGISPTYVEVDDFSAVFENLKNKTTDAGVVGRFFAIGKEDEYQVHASSLIFNPIRVHFATAQGSHAEILEGIDRNLKAMKDDPDSAYYTALQRWLGVVGEGNLPPWLKPLLLGAATVICGMIAFILLLRTQVKVRTRHLETEIVERAKTAKALQLSEQNYRELVENANAIILRWNLAGEVTFLNDFAERFFGYRKEELIGKQVIGTIVPETTSDGHDVTDMLAAILKDPDAYATNTNENICKDGRRVWVSWRNRPSCDEAGKMFGILSVGQDVTEQVKAAQKQVLLDRAKDDFISIAAHELRTPLTSIIGFSELLCNNKDNFLSEQQKLDFSAEIFNKGLFLSRTVDDLLDISRIQKGNPLPLHLDDDNLIGLVNKIIHQYRILYPDHHFDLEINATNPTALKFDQDRITQALENLLSNAVKHSKAVTPILTRIDSLDQQIQVTVADQGIGMSAEETAHIFDHFYRADQSATSIGGLGLGMSITKQVIESHGGQIKVDSTPGEGTSISFTLPA
jgi:PAS domain S-box-containing protein